MKFTWPAVILFGLICALLLGFLAWYDAPAAGPVDRHTGWGQNQAPEAIERYGGISAQRALELARARGDARQSLALLKSNMERTDRRPILTVAIFTLSAELRTPMEALAAAPEESLDRIAAIEAHKRLARRIEAGLSARETIATLRVLELDELLCEDTESFFQPLALEPPRPGEVLKGVEKHWPPDHVAAMAIAEAGGRAEEVSAENCLLLARAFRASERPRARMRWLIRAFANEPDSVKVAMTLSAAYLEHARHLEAFATLDAVRQAGADDIALEKQRSEIAAALSLSGKEAESLEAILAKAPDTSAELRLIDLYKSLGRTDDALHHISSLVKTDASPESLTQAAYVALEFCETDTAFELFEKAIDLTEEPRALCETLADLYLMDLRVDSAIELLKNLHESWPGGGYDHRLEPLLRGRHRRQDLLDLLTWRLNRDKKPNLEAEREIMALCRDLGLIERGRAVLQRQVDRIEDPAEFFEQLPFYHAAGLSHLPENAHLLAGVERFSEENVPTALMHLQELSGVLGFKAVALSIAGRYPDHPATIEYLKSLREGSLPEDVPPWGGEEVEGPNPLDVHLRLLTLAVASNPMDLESRRDLAEMLEVADLPAEAAVHWKVLAAVDGPGSASESRLLEAYDAAGMIEEELELLTVMARRGGLSTDDRSRYGERFFGAGRTAISLEMFRSVLADRPDDLLALKRVGQLLAWENDPFGAIPLLERVIELQGPIDPETLCVLGEAFWSCGRDEDAREKQRAALALLEASNAEGVVAGSMKARIYARLDRPVEACALFEKLIGMDPDNQDLVLDYADGLIILGRKKEARAVLEGARSLDPESRRLLRQDGQLLLQEERFEEAAEVFRKAIELHGSDPGLYAGLGDAESRLGHIAAAEHAYAQVVRLQPDSRNVAWIHRQLADLVASPLVNAVARYRTVADDRALEISAGGSILLDPDRLRLSALLGYGDYRGSATGAGGEVLDIDSSFQTVGFGLTYRLGNDWVVGGGPVFYPGRDDADQFGFWAEAGYRSQTPYRSYSIRITVNEAWTDPFAAAGLGGTRDGIFVEAFVQGTPPWWWVGGHVVYRSLSADSPSGGRVTNGWAELELVVGASINDEGPQVQERLRPLRCPPVLVGPTVIGEPPEETGPRAAVWFAFSASRLFDSEELSEFLPLGTEFDYLTIAGRIEDVVVPGLVYEVEAYLGTDLLSPGLFGGIYGGFSWRPDPAVDVRLGGTYGRALDRPDEEGAVGIALTATLSW